MKKLFCALVALMLAIGLTASYASYVPRPGAPEYKVAFFASENYHTVEESGKMSGYGYELMQSISGYMQCTFSYVGYDKSPEECINMLRNGEIDLYTAAASTPERRAEFAYSDHRAIVAGTYLNIKAGNKKIIEGNYSTYDGMKIGLLRRHSYNDDFIKWATDKGFSFEVFYYDTQNALSEALISGKIDALLNSYMRLPDDERTIETFGQTPYYIIARKEDSGLIEQIDAAIDALNTEQPSKRMELYNHYFSAKGQNRALTENESALLASLKESGTVILAVMKPDAAPYSWYENGEAFGISADFFRATADALGLKYEIIPVSDRAEYNKVVDSGIADILINTIFCYEEEGSTKYKLTDAYLSSSVSILRAGRISGNASRLAVTDRNLSVNEILSSYWPTAEIILTESTSDCVEKILSGEVDGAFLMTYMAQTLARSDVLNRLSVDIVPAASLDIKMAVNADCDVSFYGLWEKTLAGVSRELQTETIHYYTDASPAPTVIAYLFDNPAYLLCTVLLIFMMVLFLTLYIQTSISRRDQKKITDELATALENVKHATEAKENFFSKMSHDIRTPLNAVLGMTQIAQRYTHDPEKLGGALNSIKSEGYYLLGLINSILDANQLEHGIIHLESKPFHPAVALKNTIDLLTPLSEDKSQILTADLDFDAPLVSGDESRFGQIAMNIISNAIKYTDTNGHIKITLSGRDDGTYIFTCRDDGIGMEQELVDHITEEYVRAEDSRVSKTQGTGLGMAVVKGLLDLMHGTLFVTSEIGKGSEFTVKIPFKLAESLPEESVASAVAKPVKLSGKKVLLAEDNDLNAVVASELLQTLDLEVDRVENGLLAVEKFTSSAPGEYFAVFMDMQMPIMDGIAAAAKIRSLDRTDNSVTIYAMTANTFADDIKRCLDVGMNGYIAKPIDIDEIARMLSEQK